MNKRIAIIMALALFPFVLNTIWTGTGLGWLYWLSRLLLDGEKVFAGFLLLVFPQKVQKYFGQKPEIRVTILLMALGIFFCANGGYLLVISCQRWLVECQNPISCLK